jgi:hypothetical protein
MKRQTSLHILSLLTSKASSKITFFSFLLLLTFATRLYAQNAIQTTAQPVFYVQLGLLRYPDTLQFANLQTEGKLYQEAADNNMTRILIGKYPDRKTAVQKVETIKQKGFNGVFIVQRNEQNIENQVIATTNDVAKGVAPTAENSELKLYSVQLGAFKTKSQIPNTKHIEQYGKIILVQEGAYTKLRLGMFKQEEDALAILNRVKAYGFPQAGLFVVHGLPASSREGFIPTTENAALQTASFYKRMQGKINGSQAVVVHLYYTETSFSGYYTEPMTAERKKFTYYGVNLNDKTQPQQRDVYITRFGGDSFGLNFGIKDKDTGKENVFSLNEQYQKGSANFDVVTVYRKKIKRLTHGEIGADVFVEYPMMTTYADKLVQQKFNASALQFTDGHSGSNINTKIESQLLSDLNQINQYFPKYNWISETYENRVIENSNYLLSIRYHVESILASPKVNVKHKTFNLKNGQLLTKNDIFIANPDNELKKLLDSKLKVRATKLKIKPADVSKITTAMLQNYYVTSFGIVFFYDNQALNKQAAIEVCLPFKEMKNIVKAEFLKEFGLK